jgi:hypothetical protein
MRRTQERSGGKTGLGPWVWSKRGATAALEFEEQLSNVAQAALDPSQNTGNAMALGKAAAWAF